MDNHNTLRRNADWKIEKNFNNNNILSINEINDLINSSNLTELAGTESTFEHENDWKEDMNISELKI